MINKNAKSNFLCEITINFRFTSAKELPSALMINWPTSFFVKLLFIFFYLFIYFYFWVFPMVSFYMAILVFTLFLLLNLFMFWQK